MNQKRKTIVSLIPSIGILIFVGLYIVSAQLYPGGSKFNIHTIGFDWIHNYWCNLMNPLAMNGQQNPAQPIAISALVILSVSIFIFFIQFAKAFTKNLFWKKVIPWFGGLTMVFTSLISTKFHDQMTTLSSVFGVLVVIGIIWEVHKSDLKHFKIHGIIGIGLMILNNYIYYTLNGIAFLPVLQKITFVYILVWIIGLNFHIVKKNRLVRSETKTIKTAL